MAGNGPADLRVDAFGNGEVWCGAMLRDVERGAPTHALRSRSLPYLGLWRRVWETGRVRWVACLALRAWRCRPLARHAQGREGRACHGVTRWRGAAAVLWGGGEQEHEEEQEDEQKQGQPQRTSRSRPGSAQPDGPDRALTSLESICNSGIHEERVRHERAVGASQVHPAQLSSAQLSSGKLSSAAAPSRAAPSGVAAGRAQALPRSNKIQYSEVS